MIIISALIVLLVWLLATQLIYFTIIFYCKKSDEEYSVEFFVNNSPRVIEKINWEEEGF